MHIRPYQPSDLPRLRDMTVEAFNGVSIDQGIEQEFGPINGRDWKWRKARHVDEDVAREPEGIFVAEEDGPERTILGYISSRQDREAGVGMIPNMVVADGHRGKGIGRRLLEHVLQHFRESGLTHARIETLEQNDVGNALYRSCGFREVARQIHFCMELGERT